MRFELTTLRSNGAYSTGPARHPLIITVNGLTVKGHSHMGPQGMCFSWHFTINHRRQCDSLWCHCIPWVTSSPFVIDKEVCTFIQPKGVTKPMPKSHLYRPTSWDHPWDQFFINLCPIKRQKPHSNLNRVAYDRELLNNDRLFNSL